MKNFFDYLFVQQRFKTSLIIRYSIIIITEYLYKYYGILYTDIDYHVFSDGANHISKFENPYKRETYRYTPLLALLMIPNIKIWYPLGKFLLSTIDVGVGYLIEKLLICQNKPTEMNLNDIINKDEKKSEFAFSSLFYLYNPLTVVICTRGSADCIITFLVILSLILLEKNKIYLGALVYGFAIHFKIYPIIYSPAIYLYLVDKLYVQKSEATEFFINSSKNDNKKNVKKISKTKFRIFIEKIFYPIKLIFLSIFKLDIFLFTVITASVFILLLLLFYKLIGYKFLYEYLIYHIVRKDHRHNYSIFYYLIYLTYDSNLSKYLSLITFLPQMILIYFATALLYKKINLCLVILTMIFVFFNKVITAQYFIWFFSLIPLIINQNKLFSFYKIKGLILLIIWLFFEIIWNYYSHLLEYNGQNTFIHMLIINLIFFLISSKCISEIIINNY